MNDEVAYHASHTNHDHGPPDQAQPEALPQGEDEQRREDVELHVVGHVPGYSHALQSFHSGLVVYQNG